MTFATAQRCFLATLVCASHGAMAQTPAAPPAGPVVTVQGERPGNRIDRQVYDVKTDAATTNSSAADALGNVPSVTVDPDGSVTLRGSSNVQIMIDGKPSAMLQGEGRGAALNALPSNDIESIEVINNPGAQFGNEGGGGPILNLVMRRNRTPGGLGVVNANAGPHGRVNTALSGSYQQGRFGFQGGINFRRDGRNTVGHTSRERIDPITGAVSASSQDSVTTGLNNSAGVNAGLTYNLDDKTALGAQFSVMRRSNDQRGSDQYHNAASGALPAIDYLRTSERGGASENSSWGLRLDRKGSVAGETFKMDLRISSADTSADSAYANTYPNAPQRRSRQDNATGNTIADFTGDYERPVDQGIVKLGYKLSEQQNSFDTMYADIDALNGASVVNTGRSNRFQVDESNLALYGSYQRRLDARWGVLGGLRVEHTALDVRQFTSGVESSNSYTHWIPSLFVTYKASDNANVRLSYAHRLRRPNGNDLNPFIVYRDEFNVSAGNPLLRPSQSDSLELGYETRFGIVETSLRAYVRKESDVISERSYFISDTVLLTTRDNAGESRSGGLEFSLSGKVSPALSFNTSGNLGRAEQRNVDSLGAATLRKSTSLSLRGRVNYQLTKADHVQFGVHAQGKTLTGQGYREPASTANLSLRHTLTPRLSLVMNVTDLFDSNKTVTTIDTPLLRETSERRADGRVMYFGLSYRLGGMTAPAGRQPGERWQGRERPGTGGGRPGHEPGPE
ncbi:MAG: outer membrane beta-barrel family protein [Pseudomonadota bacterium]